ncbi:SDR family oxidoreductase [Catenulispora rubra]|uniref:SDR family oxidoreductase n=1 Tax=Catenulispora rubra TaxID=280293 RepID=UPI0018923B5C|nr:SDR family oxidoreductase [Catenulispora rubra]
MRVFVTGASGHIGSAVVPELLEAGHQVVGLARNDAAAERVAARGAEVHRGDVFDPDSYLDALDAADGVIHLAYDHSFTDMAAAAAEDLRVTKAIGERLAGTGKSLVATSGTLMLARRAPGVLGLEEHTSEAGPRVDTENAVVALAERGVRSSVVRLAPLVHSDLDHHGFSPVLIRVAREKGFAAYVGDGANRWPALNTRDAARIYRLAVESAPGGTRLHGVENEGYAFRLIAETIAERLGVPAASIAAEDAAAHFGFLGFAVGADNPTSNAFTRKTLGWEPEHIGLIEDLKQDHYFVEQ